MPTALRPALRRPLALAAATVAFLALVRTDAVPALRGPAPWPPEWQWLLQLKPVDGRVVPALVCVALLGLLAWGSGSAPAASRPRLASRLVLLAGTLLGVALQLALLDVQPAGMAHELAQRTVSPSFTSYHRVASTAAGADPALFLERHADLLPSLRKGAPHAATHPPGPVLYYRGLIALTARMPWLADLAARSGVDAGALVPAQSREGIAAALLGGLLLGVMGGAACWPVAALARRAGTPPLAAARIGLLWVAVPALVLMVPELDAALALLVTASAAYVAAAAQRSLGWASVAGGIAGLALFFSYGAAVMVAIAGLAAVQLGRPTLRHAASVVMVASASAIAVVLVPALWGYRPWLSAVRAIAIHREQFTEPRSWSLWLAFGPLDLAIFLGVPVTLLLILQLMRAQPDEAVRRFRIAALAGTAALLVSGTVRGEVGRILIPLMPLLLLAALLEPAAEDAPSAGFTTLLVLLLGACCLTLRLSWQLP